MRSPTRSRYYLQCSLAEGVDAWPDERFWDELRLRLEHYKDKSSAGLDHYSDRALARVWKAERFSWWLTTLLHTFPDSAFEQKMHLAELDYLFKSRAAETAFTENYVGLPF
jgi:hypothetical protein